MQPKISFNYISFENLIYHYDNQDGNNIFYNTELINVPNINMILAKERPNSERTESFCSYIFI